MTPIDQSNYAQFAKRFYDFYDSVIRSLEITFRFHTNISHAVIVITVRDSAGSENEGWVGVR
jgi:hypothetical protein